LIQGEEALFKRAIAVCRCKGVVLEPSSIAGVVVDRFADSPARLILKAVAVLALVAFAALMPETSGVERRGAPFTV
jgi:hypothetical protein